MKNLLKRYRPWHPFVLIIWGLYEITNVLFKNGSGWAIFAVAIAWAVLYMDCNPSFNPLFTVFEKFAERREERRRL